MRATDTLSTTFFTAALIGPNDFCACAAERRLRRQVVVQTLEEIGFGDLLRRAATGTRRARARRYCRRARRR